MDLAWKRITLTYLALESLATVLWWAALFRWPELRAHFWPVAALPETGLLAFLPADILFYIVATGGGVAGLVLNQRFAMPLLWVRAGGILYAALYCLGITWLHEGHGGWLSALLMGLSAAMNLALCAMRPASR